MDNIRADAQRLINEATEKIVKKGEANTKEVLNGKLEIATQTKQALINILEDASLTSDDSRRILLEQEIATWRTKEKTLIAQLR